jgi:hypothetical protein
MPALPFDTAVAVKFGAADIAEVWLGATKVWPTGQPRIVTIITNTERQLTLGIEVLNRVRDVVDIDWGDGTTSTGVTMVNGRVDASHTYATAGMKDIIVKTRGATDHVDHYNLLTPHALVLTPTVTGGTDVSLAVSLKTQVPIDINWGDGTPVEHINWPTPTATATTLTHRYAVGGTYTITGNDSGVLTKVTVSMALPPARMTDAQLTDAFERFMLDALGIDPPSGNLPSGDPATIHIKGTQRFYWPGFTPAQVAADHDVGLSKVWIAANGAERTPLGTNDGVDGENVWQGRWDTTWSPTTALPPGVYWLVGGTIDTHSAFIAHLLKIVVDP